MNIITKLDTCNCMTSMMLLLTSYNKNDTLNQQWAITYSRVGKAKSYSFTVIQNDA